MFIASQHCFTGDILPHPKETSLYLVCGNIFQRAGCPVSRRDASSHDNPLARFSQPRPCRRKRLLKRRRIAGTRERRPVGDDFLRDWDLSLVCEEAAVSAVSWFRL
jgi:hypothetical protein